MILPWWLNKNDFINGPMTLVLAAISLLFLVILPPVSSQLIRQTENQMNNQDFLKVQSYEYQSFLKSENVELFDELNSEWVGRNYDAIKMDLYWAQISFRDTLFLQNLKKLSPYPDEILYQKWIKIWDQFLVNQKIQWTTFFGISVFGQNWTSFITYQFIHSGALHFLSNMMLLLFFGLAVEKLAGSFTVVIVYILSGVIGGVFHNWCYGINLAPLVGASASVSGLMAFYFLLEERKNLKFFYFFGPFDGYFGEIYLRKEWMIPLLFLGDISAVYSTPIWQLSVAHTAHLGAVGIGFILALLWKLFKIPINVRNLLADSNQEPQFGDLL